MVVGAGVPVVVVVVCEVAVGVVVSVVVVVVVDVGWAATGVVTDGVELSDPEPAEFSCFCSCCFSCS